MILRFTERGERMTRREMERRARIRERRRRTMRARRIVFSLLAILILIPLAYSCYSYYRTGKLKKKIDSLERQLEEGQNSQKELQQRLEELEKQLKEKEEELERERQAVADDPERPNVYLTFDDGPSENTDSILNTLAEANVRATFFCIARSGQENRERYNRIVQEGHTLGMHSYSHVYKTIYASLDAFMADLTGIRDFLYEATGVQPRYYRFPGGSSNKVSEVPMEKCIRFVNEQELTYFDWNAQNDDATGREYTPAQLVSRAVENVRAAGRNVVLLMHDGREKTATAKSLPELIRKLREAGYDLLPVTEKTPLVQHVAYDSVG